jgi:hypothetical protein
VVAAVADSSSNQNKAKALMEALPPTASPGALSALGGGKKTEAAIAGGGGGSGGGGSDAAVKKRAAKNGTGPSQKKVFVAKVCEVDAQEGKREGGGGGGESSYCCCFSGFCQILSALVFMTFPSSC